MSRCYLFAMVAVLLQGCADANWPNLNPAPVQPQVLQAQKFVLLDSAGKPIAELGAAEHGSGLVLMDSKGKPRAAMVLTENGEPGLKLYDAAGVVRAALVVANDGRSGLVLYDAHDKSRAALAIGRDGAPALVLFDRDGRMVRLLAAPPEHHGRARSPSG